MSWENSLDQGGHTFYLSHGLWEKGEALGWKGWRGRGAGGAPVPLQIHSKCQSESVLSRSMADDLYLVTCAHSCPSTSFL